MPHFLKKIIAYKYFFTLCFIALACVLWALTPRRHIFEGPIYGTYFKVIVVAPKFLFNEKKTSLTIQSKLNDINAMFSTYYDGSQLSKFNNIRSIQPLLIDPLLHQMMVKSKTYYDDLNGAWDPSILPLSQKLQFQSAYISQSSTDVLSAVGFNKLRIISDNRVQKLTPDFQLDFSSFIKGYAVDQVIEYLDHERIIGAYVDIGGEIRTIGLKSRTIPWTIGIQSPTTNHLINVLELSDMAIATSGNYLNYQMIDGVKVGHILDPRTLSPITHQLLSVSVISPTCIDADAYATGLFVIGP